MHSVFGKTSVCATRQYRLSPVMTSTVATHTYARNERNARTQKYAGTGNYLRNRRCTIKITLYFDTHVFLIAPVMNSQPVFLISQFLNQQARKINTRLPFYLSLL